MEDLPSEKLRIPLIVIGAIAVTALLMWGILRGQGDDKRQAAATSPSPAPSTPAGTAAVPPSGPPSAAPTSAPATSTKPAKPSKPKVTWHGSLTIHGIAAYDLDADPPARHDRFGDIRGDFLETTLSSTVDGAYLAVTSGDPGFRTCQSRAANGTDETDTLSPGDVVCVQTDGGHVARLKITTAHQTASDPVVAASVTVWQPPQ